MSPRKKKAKRPTWGEEAKKKLKELGNKLCLPTGRLLSEYQTRQPPSPTLSPVVMPTKRPASQCSPPDYRILVASSSCMEADSQEPCELSTAYPRHLSWPGWTPRGGSSCTEAIGPCGDCRSPSRPRRLSGSLTTRASICRRRHLSPCQTRLPTRGTRAQREAQGISGPWPGSPSCSRSTSPACPGRPSTAQRPRAPAPRSPRPRRRSRPWRPTTRRAARGRTGPGPSARCWSGGTRAGSGPRTGWPGWTTCA